MKELGHLHFLDSGEIIPYYNEQEFIQAYKYHLDYLGPMAVRYRLTDEGKKHFDLRIALHQAYANEFGYGSGDPEYDISF